MNKAELLKQKAQQNTMNLYLTNENEDIRNNLEQKKDDSMQNESIINTSNKNNIEKMLSFRLPTNIIDCIDKYAYVARMKKKDVIIKCFETFFSNDEIKEILKQYDEIKGAVER